MTADDHESPDEPMNEAGDDSTLEPPIWVPRVADPAADPSAAAAVEADVEPTPFELRTGLPMSVLAGGAGVVLLAAAVVFALIATRGPADSPVSSSRAAARTPDTTPTVAAQPSRSPAVVPAVSCRYARTQAGVVPRRVDPPKETGIVKGGRVDVKLGTNQGQIVLSLDRTRTPCTVNNFLELAAQRFFDDTPCHRITTRGLFVLQCGDPGGTGTGSPGYSFADENLPAERTQPVTYLAGTVAMANSGPNTNGSQFFIVYEDTRLMPTWTVFGQVTAGLHVVQGIAATGSRPDGDGKPTRPVSIMSVTSVPPAR